MGVNAGVYSEYCICFFFPSDHFRSSGTTNFLFVVSLYFEYAVQIYWEYDEFYYEVVFRKLTTFSIGVLYIGETWCNAKLIA